MSEDRLNPAVPPPELLDASQQWCVSSCVTNACESRSFRVGPCRLVSPASHWKGWQITENKRLAFTPVTSEVAGRSHPQSRMFSY
jgi:hypothetical protein